jgi:cytochrome c peroxidase
MKREKEGVAARVCRSAAKLLPILGAAAIITVTTISCENDAIDYDALIEELGLEGLPDVSDPVINPSTPEKVELGRLLFWDPVISGMQDVACATCHHPDHAYTDNLDLSIGVNGTGLGPDRAENTGGLPLNPLIARVPRNAPTILNTAYNGLTRLGDYDPLDAIMFWDGRMLSLEAQCQGPPASRSEMRGDAYEDSETFDHIIAKLRDITEYVDRFDDCFGGGSSAVNPDNYSFAIGAFERTIVTDNSPYLRYINGDRKALTDQQKNGLLLFHGDAGCVNCHGGPMLSDFNFHTLGVPDNPDHPEGTDAGKDDLYAFRTPSLHNIALTGPYGHNGMFASLREAVEFMAGGESQNPNVSSGMLDIDFVNRNLTGEQVDDLVAFLESLTDTDFDKTVPASVPSGLPVGGNIQ